MSTRHFEIQVDAKAQSARVKSWVYVVLNDILANGRRIQRQLERGDVGYCRLPGYNQDTRLDLFVTAAKRDAGESFRQSFELFLADVEVGLPEVKIWRKLYDEQTERVQKAGSELALEVEKMLGAEVKSVEVFRTDNWYVFDGVVNKCLMSPGPYWSTADLAREQAWQKHCKVWCERTQEQRDRILTPAVAELQKVLDETLKNLDELRLFLLERYDIPAAPFKD